jgi:hypothetical protein
MMTRLRLKPVSEAVAVKNYRANDEWTYLERTTKHRTPIKHHHISNRRKTHEEMVRGGHWIIMILSQTYCSKTRCRNYALEKVPAVLLQEMRSKLARGPWLTTFNGISLTSHYSILRAFLVVSLVAILFSTLMISTFV